jgi:hypothetical protein
MLQRMLCSYPAFILAGGWAGEWFWVLEKLKIDLTKLNLQIEAGTELGNMTQWIFMKYE